MKSHLIDFEPIGRRGRCKGEQSLLDCAQQLGVELVSICGGKGTCGRCRVQIISGRISSPTSNEKKTITDQELKDGYRLACQTYPIGNCRIRVPQDSLTTPQRTQVEGLEVVVSPEPPVSAYRAELTPPSLSDLEADAERLLAALEQKHQVRCESIDIGVLRDLSPNLRACGWDAQASVRSNELVAVGPWPGRQLGLAVDLGTTKIAVYLIDLETAQTLASRGIMNPQIAYGEDVISRISRTRGVPAEAARLQGLVVEALNRTAEELCTETGTRPVDIVEAVVVGNTAMHHLFLHLSAEQLALSPYVPAIRKALDIKARDLGIHIAPGAYVHLLPNIAGFVGADHVAMLLAIGAWQSEGTVLALDIGTNTEVCLLSNGRMTSVSCASGPAFEGAHIKHGMRAASGAIERLLLAGDRVEYQTINGAPPVGFCGSGILDAIAQLYLASVIEANGRMNVDHPQVRVIDGEREFVMVSGEKSGGPVLTVTQGDVREIQLAKGAIRTGIQVLLEANGLSEEDIEEVIIAGAFGSYIDIVSAITIGMLPLLSLERFRQVGNAAGTGARMALISRNKRSEAHNIAGRVSYIELATTPHFTHTFAQANYIGLYRMTDGKRKEIEEWRQKLQALHGR